VNENPERRNEMTLAEAETMCRGDEVAMATVATIRRKLGEAVRIAVMYGDGSGLEKAARVAGTYRALMAAATAAGVDRDDLEDALARL
jgi:hypothetical protein